MGITAHDLTADDGTRLRAWERMPSGATEAVLFLHGAITCSRALFAPPVPDDTSFSWLHAAAEAGRAAFAVDIRGYGESERPPEMDEPPDANDPPVRAADAVADVRAAHEFVADSYDVIHLVGVSWGSMNAGTFLTETGAKVTSLTQCAPVYSPPYDFEPAMSAFGVDPDLGAWYSQERDVVLARQDGGEPSPLFEAVWRTQIESNQGVEGRDAYIAQTGALADVQQSCAGDPVYDAADISIPTLVVRGTEDGISRREDALTLYENLGSEADRREYAEIGGADHYAMHGDRRRALYDTVTAFQNRA